MAGVGDTRMAAGISGEASSEGNGAGRDLLEARTRARVYLTPIAPPATLGLFGFFASTMVVSTWLLHWWGSTASVPTMFAIAPFFGGAAQFASGLWCFRARDYIGSALLTMWGTFWMGWGVLQGLGIAHAVTILPQSAANPGFGVWFIPLALFTLWGAVVAIRVNLPLFLVLATVGAGCGAAAGGFWVGSPGWIHVGAWLFVFGACFAWYTAAMLVLEYTWGKVILPMGALPKLTKLPGSANIPGTVLSHPVEYALGQPGTRREP